MRNRENKGIFLRWFLLCPLRHVLALLAALAILLQRAARGNGELMSRLAEESVRPKLRALGSWCARFPFSVAEAGILLSLLLLVLYILWSLRRIGRSGVLRTLYRLLMTFLCLALLIYAGFCLLWGICYYGEDFTTKSSLATEPISVEQLWRTTEYFAALANQRAERVARGENGVCATDRQAVLARSATLYADLEKVFPTLEGPPLAAKPFRLSKILSLLDFSGFFFPFTGEANVNTDFPPSLFAATVAHELAHQRGVAREDEANFVGILACLASGDDDYVYSAALLAYTHLSNALYEAEPDIWHATAMQLSEPVRRDIEANRVYWSRYGGLVQSVSNAVYEDFLQSYDQTLGLQSYGACVDLLVNYISRGGLTAFPNLTAGPGTAEKGENTNGIDPIGGDPVPAWS